MAGWSAGRVKDRVVVNSLSTAPGKRTLQPIRRAFSTRIENYLFDPLGCDTESHLRQVLLW